MLLDFGSLGARRLALIGLAVVAMMTAYLALPNLHASKLLLVAAFAAAVTNIVVSEWTTGEVAGADLLLLFASGFAASAHGAFSIAHELSFALLRVALLGAAVSAFAWAYQQWRGASGLSQTDIALIAILGAFMPLAVAIYAVAFAITLTIAAIAALHLYRGEQTHGRSQLPIASSLSVVYFCVWIAYRLTAGSR